jgi:hypothetical protein
VHGEAREGDGSTDSEAVVDKCPAVGASHGHVSPRARPRGKRAGGCPRRKHGRGATARTVGSAHERRGARICTALGKVVVRGSVGGRKHGGAVA